MFVIVGGPPAPGYEGFGGYGGPPPPAAGHVQQAYGGGQVGKHVKQPRKLEGFSAQSYIC